MEISAKLLLLTMVTGSFAQPKTYFFDWDGSQRLTNDFSRMMQDICMHALLGVK